MDREVKEVVDEVIKKFTKDYPAQQRCEFFFNPIIESLEIMLPKYLPISHYKDPYERLAIELQFPAIEVIDISEKYQRKGVLNHLIERLLEVSWVQGVVIQTINNPELARHLLHSPKWVPFINSHSYSKLNRIIPLARDNQEYYDFFLELFDKKRPVIHKGDMTSLKNNFIKGVEESCSDEPPLTDDQLCFFARIGEPNGFFDVPDELYEEFKNYAIEQGLSFNESPYDFAGKSSFITSFLTTKPLAKTYTESSGSNSTFGEDIGKFPPHIASSSQIDLDDLFNSLASS